MDEATSDSWACDPEHQMTRNKVLLTQVVESNLVEFPGLCSQNMPGPVSRPLITLLKAAPQKNPHMIPNAVKTCHIMTRAPLTLAGAHSEA